MMAPLKGAFLGFGKIAELGHWPTYGASQDIDIVAVMDSSEERQAVAKALKPGLRTYRTAEDLFQGETVDFVDICTPPSSHAPLTLHALENHCHVLCEKPLTLKSAEYTALSIAMERSQKTIFTVHNWKCAPIFQKAFSLIRAGTIGPVRHVDLFTLRSDACAGSVTGATSSDWRKNASVAGGGILADHGWHAFYLLMNLTGARPETILAKMLKDRRDPAGLEQAVQAVIEFPEATGYMHLSWQADKRRSTVLVQGRDGTLLIDEDRLLLTTNKGDRQEFPFKPGLSSGSHHPDWFKSLLPEFQNEVRDPARRGSNFVEAGWCLALTQAAYQSNQSGFEKVSVALSSGATRKSVLSK